MAMSQTDIDRVKAAFDTVKADMGRRLTTTLRGAVNGVAELDASRLVPTDRLGTGTAGAATILYGNRTWGAAPAGGSGTPTVETMPAGFAMITSSTTRPTARTDIPVIFTGADPGANKLVGDVWLGS